MVIHLNSTLEGIALRLRRPVQFYSNVFMPRWTSADIELNLPATLPEPRSEDRGASFEHHESRFGRRGPWNSDFGLGTSDRGYLGFFCEDGHQVFEDWRQELEDRLRDPDSDETPTMLAHLGKWPYRIPALMHWQHLTKRFAPWNLLSNAIWLQAVLTIFSKSGRTIFKRTDQSLQKKSHLFHMCHQHRLLFQWKQFKNRVK